MFEADARSELDHPTSSGMDLSNGALVRFSRAASAVTERKGQDPGKPLARDPLDSAAAMQVHHRLIDAYTRELDRQYNNRRQMQTDEAFYDGEQWRPEDLAILEDRGQVPLVFNLIAVMVDWVTGTEKRGRSDYKILPRGKEDAKAAERKTQLLKYLSDVNRTGFHTSRAFQDAVRVGLGWLEDGADDDNDGELIYSRYESWRNMLWDSTAVELDLVDARYWFRSKWVDLDIAVAMFPRRAGLIELSAEDGDRFLGGAGDFGDEPMDEAEDEMYRFGSLSRYPNRYGRERVRMIEAWYRSPMAAGRMIGGQFSGELYDPWSPGHRRSIEAGEAEVLEKPIMRVQCALMTPKGLLYKAPSPYRHNRSPFTPIWGYRRGKDGLPYGLIRRIRDINEDYNKRASKALHILSTNKTVMDEGAVDDIDEFADEVARPDSIIVKKPGKELRLDAERDLSERHVMLMDRDAMMVQMVSGINNENLGRATNASSGIAIERRQTEGSVSSTVFFDNLRLAKQVQGEKQLSLTEQFMDQRKQFRITNTRGVPQYVTINDPNDPDSDITQSKADFVISEADWRASVREEHVDRLLEAVSKMPPEIATAVLDLVVEEMDLSNREEIVKRIRTITGQRDPDADEPTPEEQAREQAQAEAAALQKERLLAEIRKLISEAAKNEAAAEKAAADTTKAHIASFGGPKRGAIDVAADIMAAPAVVPVADAILADAGYVGATDKAAAAVAAQPPGAAPPSQPPQPAAPTGPGPRVTGITGA